MSAVPVIDIGPFLEGSPSGRRDVARQFDEACTKIGFFAIAGHGVPQADLDHVRAVAHAFFALETEEKERFVPIDPGRRRGYGVLAGEAIGRTYDPSAAPDLKEFYYMGREAWPEDAYHNGQEGREYFVPNLWPDRLPGFAEAAMGHYRAMEALDATLMRIAAVSLGLPDRFFDDKIDQHVSAMRFNYYPPLTDTPEPGQIRNGAHTDYGLFTLLLGEGGESGLQVRTRNGEWVDVATETDSFVVNIGDLLMHWTNDRWLSNLHRVANPPRGAARASGRLSIAFFQQPNYDAMIECIPSCIGPGNPARYPPVRSGDYRFSKYVAAAL